MKYVHEISKEENLREVNESVFQMRKILDSYIEKFIQYYSVAELSESDEEQHDFEDDGKSVMPQKDFGNNGGT